MHSDKERVHEVDWGGTSLAQCGVIRHFSPCLYFLVNTVTALRCSIFTVEPEKRRSPGIKVPLSYKYILAH